jgi:hypothetical protein
LTRFIWDKFSKDLIETLLSPYGQVIVSKEVTSEVQKIDLWFSPHHRNISENLGLLGKLSQIPCLFEPFKHRWKIYPTVGRKEAKIHRRCG